MPVDDPVFQRINLAQWIWYGSQIAKDDEENFELFRDIAEHNAMFSNPKGVAEVRQAREQTFKMSNKDFDTLIENTFGHKINLNKKIVIDKKDVEKKVNTKSYLDMELDDIKFIPFEE